MTATSSNIASYSPAMFTHRSLVVFGVLCLGVACQDTGGPSLQFRPEMEIVAGDAQVDTVARQLPTAIAARVLDSATRQPRAGILVSWVVVQGGGSVFAGAALTNDSGLARERWTLGTTAGPQRLEARAVDPVTGQPVVYAQVNATAVPGPLAYTGFSADRARVFGDSLVRLPVTAVDAYGNAVAVPAVTGLDGLDAQQAGDTVRVLANQLGQFRFTLGTDTFRLFVHAPTGPWRHTQTRADTVWEQTGILAFLYHGPGPDTTAWYEVQDYRARKIVSGLVTDSLSFTSYRYTSHSVYAALNGPRGDIDFAFARAPTGTNQGSWASLTSRAGATWIFTQPGQTVVIDSIFVR